MPTLHIDQLFGGTGDGFLPDDLFDRFGPTLEALRVALLAEASEDGHAFFHIPPHGKTVVEVRAAARNLRRIADELVVVGIGGSALGAKVLASLPEGGRLHFMEGLDPATVEARLAEIPWERAALNFVSKSGNTVETLVNAGFCIEALRRANPRDWRDRIVITCSEGDGRLQRWGEEHAMAPLLIPEPVGGRYSVLSAVGLLPAAFAGTDPTAVVAGAKAGADKCLLLSGRENPALSLAISLFSFFQAGKGEVALWGYGETCWRLARWIQQLWGESLGRCVGEGEAAHRVGATPLACRGSEDQHSLLQLFMDGPRRRWVLFLTADGRGPALSPFVRELAGLPDRTRHLGEIQGAFSAGTRRALAEQGVPAASYDLGSPNAAALGEAFYVFEAATLYAAKLFEIDPFGQPGVEAGKRYAREILERGPSAS